MYSSFFQNAISKIKQEGRYRVFINLERLSENPPYASWADEFGLKRKVINWCSNDYLNMSHHQDVISAMVNATKKYGAGSGGTRNISGSCKLHVELEEQIAKIHNKQKALIFGSGYTANEATISSIVKCLPECVIFSDEKNHASIIKGIANSGVQKIIFEHSNISDLESKISLLPFNQAKIIVFTSVYSMDGDFAPIAQMIAVAKKYNALTFLDEVHAVGIYAENGGGLSKKFNLENDIDIIQGNFAKAYGVVGGYIASSKEIIDYTRSCASGFIFTTSIPPCVAAACLESSKILEKDKTIREKFWENVQYLKYKLSQTSINFIKNESHIIPILIGDPFLCKKICDDLLNRYNIYVQPINYPTVPKGFERIRITITPAHTKAMIDDFVEKLTICIGATNTMKMVNFY
jgi:5-aminolevulinate synthase